MLCRLPSALWLILIFQSLTAQNKGAVGAAEKAQAGGQCDGVFAQFVCRWIDDYDELRRFLVKAVEAECHGKT